MAQVNQDISFNNNLSNVETKLDTVIQNTLQDYCEVAIQICDVPGSGSPVPIMMVGHYRTGVLQSVEYRTLFGNPYTVSGTLANCTSGTGSSGTTYNYTTVLSSIDANTSNTNSNVALVNSNLNTTNSSLSSIDTGITAINAKLNQTCAGNPIKVTVCNPTTIDFTATNGLLSTGNTNTSNINTAIGTTNTSIASSNTKLDTANTTLGSILSKLNQTCGGTPINVNVCNPSSGGGGSADFTATNAILTTMDGRLATINTNTGATTTAIGSTNTKLDTVNTNLTTIVTKLGQSCAGSPINVNICNQLDLSTMQASLASIDSKSSSIVSNTSNTANNTATVATNSTSIASSSSTTATNTGNIATSNSTIATNSGTLVTNTANTKTSVDTLNTNLTSLKTQLTAINTNHVVIDNLPAAPFTYNNNENIVIGGSYATTFNFVANTYHSIRVQVITGTGTITQNTSTIAFTAPAGYTYYVEATTVLSNAITVSCTSSDIVAITTTRS